jgi:hypothetical protein
MRPFLTSDLKVKFLGITPVFNDKTGILNPQEIAAFSALLTFKGKSIKNLLKDTLKKGENLKERIGKILQSSSLRGHASIATTPSLCLNYEGSKFLDSALTGIIFSSSLVSSGRRTETTERDIVFPNRIFSNRKARKIYRETSEKIIKFFNFLLSRGIQKDEASKILQYGIYGTGIINLPLETIVGLKREYLAEKIWMPEEIGILLKKIEENLEKLGIDWLYATREAAPRNVYPYPNIFKDPKKSNLVRELIAKEKLPEGAKLLSLDIQITPDLKKKLEELERKTREIFSSLEKIKKYWLELINLRQQIFRDYNLTLRFKVLSSIPWRVWGEKKRHRTCPQIIESIYYCVERAAKTFIKHKKQIKAKKINKKLVKEIEGIFSIPPTIKNDPEYLARYLLTAQNAFEAYQNLIKLGIKPREAIFLVPRGVKIDILQEYDLYNLLTGYYPLRTCSTAEEEMFRNSWREVQQIKKALKEKGLGFLNQFIAPKCHIMGFCPEQKSCSLILPAVRNYNEKFHQEMKAELKKLLEKNLKNLGNLR